MIEIAGRRIGPNHPPRLVADVGANHDGSLLRALTLATLAANSGADFVKYQSFDEKTIVSRRGFAEIGQIGHQSQWEKPVYETYAAAALPLEWIPTLAQHCRELGVGFMSTAYSLEIADAIDPYVDAHKTGSGDLTWPELIRHVAGKKKPILMATGASTAEDVNRALFSLSNWTDQVVLMQCNSDYTGGIVGRANLNVLWNWQDREGYGVRVGLSDHTPGHVTVCAAVALGACVIEKHFTDDKGRPGPDHAFAMEPEEWRGMVTAARQTWEALGDGVKKVEENEREARIVQRRALRYRIPIAAGRIATAEVIIPTRPCPEGALEPYRLDEVIGRRLRRDVEADTLVRLEDLE